MGTTVTSLKIDEDLWKEARIYAIKHAISFGDVVTLALKSFLRQNQK